MQDISTPQNTIAEPIYPRRSKEDMSILLVDDDPFVLDIAVRTLENLGYSQITTANNGNTALGKLITTESAFDIIICDLNMPEMDGVEFVRHASEAGFCGGLILLSGEDPRMLEIAYSLGMSHKLDVLGALAKPLQPKELDRLLNQFEPTQSETPIRVQQQSISLDDLRSGIKGSSKNQLMLVYQPKIHLQSGVVSGVETLARWWNQDRGVLDPAAFIPLAEESGLIDALTNEIYKRAIMQVAQWNRHDQVLKTAVNFSINSFGSNEFCEFIVDTTLKHGVNPSQILLEVKETQAIALPLNCTEALMKMRLKRFGLCIDNFGTGNSSLAQLRNIPFTEMKIDRAFVCGASEDPSARAILEASIGLARKLEIEIVAEGAETEQEWKLVKDLGCDYAQGFFCARPMRSEDLPEFIDKWSQANPVDR
jgi:EAL domain-containing protein (putative c-di-GMP-specific phosphodiesterase class I)